MAQAFVTGIPVAAVVRDIPKGTLFVLARDIHWPWKHNSLVFLRYQSLLLCLDLFGFCVVHDNIVADFFTQDFHATQVRRFE